MADHILKKTWAKYGKKMEHSPGEKTLTIKELQYFHFNETV
jgi:hypothetical protein